MRNILAVLLLAAPCFSNVYCKYDAATLNRSGVITPLSFASITVCPSGSSGAPCSPKSSLFNSSGAAISNPATADDSGNYLFCVNTPGRYMIQVSAQGANTAVQDNQIIPSDPNSPSFGGDVSIAGALSASGAVRFIGPFVPTDVNTTTLEVSGLSTLNGVIATTLGVSGVTSLATLNVSGVSTLSGGVSAKYSSVDKNIRDARQDGVVCDGTSEDGVNLNTAITNAVANGQSIIQLPSGMCKVSTVPNVTNRPAMTFQGVGSYGTNVVPGSYTVIMCNTGAACLELVGSGRSTVRKLTLWMANSFSTPSTIGILEGRDNALGGGTGRFCFAENNRIEDVSITTDINTALNAGRGYIGIMNIGAESSVVSNVDIQADTPIFQSPTNDLVTVATYQNLATGCPASMAQTTYINSDFASNSKQAMEIRGSLGVDLINVDLLSNATATGVTPILFAGGDSSGIRLNVIVESFKSPVAGFANASANISDISGTVLIGGQTGTAAAAWVVGAVSLSLNNPNLQIFYQNGTVNSFTSSFVPYSINGGTLDIAGTTSPLNQTNFTLTGTKVKAQGFADASVTFNAASTYEIQTDAGVFEHQPATFTGQIISTLAPGTPPLVVASPTNIPNLNASSLNGATMAIPGAIGSTTPSTGKFTTVQSTIATGTPPLTVASTTLVTNLNTQIINGVTVTGTPSAGQGIIATSASAATWQAIGGSFSCVNVTPVTTASVSTTADQLLMACTIPSGTLNTLGKTLSIQTAGVYSTPAASTTTVNFKVKLCTVSGCGSGTVVNLVSLTSAALGAIQATNDPFNLQIFLSTQTAGASAAFEAHGNLTIDISALTTAAEGVYADGNLATVGTIDSTGVLFLQVTVAFSAANAANNATDRQLTGESIN